MMILDHYYFSGFKNVDVAPGLAYRPSLGMALAFSFQLYYLIMDDFIGVSGAVREAEAEVSNTVLTSWSYDGHCFSPASPFRG